MLHRTFRIISVLLSSRTSLASFAIVAALTAVACAPPGPLSRARHHTSTFPVTRASLSSTRAGIAIVGTGGLAGLERAMALDSATGHFMTVTRRACGPSCAPLDSASGTLTADAVARIYAVVDHERVFALRDAYGICEECDDQALFTTAVFANDRRKVITSDRETTPEVLGRVHVALADAIRSARGVR